MNPHQVASKNYPQATHDAPHGVGHIVPLADIGRGVCGIDGADGDYSGGVAD